VEFKQSLDRIRRLPTSIVIAAALLTVWLAQGSTFVALKVGVAAVPPFLLSGARFMVVGLTLLIWSAWRAQWHLSITRREAVLASAAGAGFFFAGQGSATWASQFLPAGIVAVLNSTMPLWAVLLSRLALRTPLRITALSGIVASFVGVTFLAWPGANSGITPAPAVAVVVGSACWAGSAVVVNRTGIGRRPVLITGLQTFVGGALQLMAAVVTGELAHIAPQAVVTAVPAFIYLIIVSSLVGFPVLTWLLSQARLEIANTAAFVAPAIALGLGALLLREQITPRMLAGVAVILVGVVLIVLSGGRKRSKTAASEHHAIKTLEVGRRGVYG